MQDPEFTLGSGASGVAAGGPPTVCVTENSWRPSLVAEERLSGPHQGSVEVLADYFLPRVGA